MSKTEQRRGVGALTITRIFDSHREQVWKAWTEPELVRKWWGPRGYITPVAKIDLRVGGSSLSCMRSPDGKDIWSVGTYREIVKPERLVLTDSFSDPTGKIVPASHYGMSGEWPLELQVTVTVAELDGKTKLTLRHVGFPDDQSAEMAKTGWNESFDKLVEYLETGDVKSKGSPSSPNRGSKR